MRESPVERALVKDGKKKGIEWLKFKTPTRRDVPDRITFLDGPLTILVECKRPGEDLRKRQVMYCNELIEKGFLVYVLDNTEDAKRINDEVLTLSD